MACGLPLVSTGSSGQSVTAISSTSAGRPSQRAQATAWPDEDPVPISVPVWLSVMRPSTASSTLARLHCAPSPKRRWMQPKPTP
jgi:hypothetical protein